MLGLIAHSRHGVLDRHAAVLNAHNSLTEGGVGVRINVPGIAGQLPEDLEVPFAQAVLVARAVGAGHQDQNVVIETIRRLASAESILAARWISIEALLFEQDAVPEVIATAYPLRMTDGRRRVGLSQSEFAPAGLLCTDSWLCATRRTNSRAAGDQLRRKIHGEGFADIAWMENNRLRDIACSTMVAMRADGELSAVGTRCEICADHFTSSTFRMLGFALATPRGLSIDSLPELVGAWLIDPVAGISEVAAVGEHSIRWQADGLGVSRVLRSALNGSAADETWSSTTAEFPS